jgi:hypothetical protein
MANKSYIENGVEVVSLGLNLAIGALLSHKFSRILTWVAWLFLVKLDYCIFYKLPIRFGLEKFCIDKITAFDMSANQIL